MDVKDLIGYSHVVRGLYFDALAKLPWAEVVASRGLSFDCLRDVFLHLTLVEDRWISYIIPDRFSSWVDLNFDDFKDPESLRRYMQQTQSNTEKYRSNLSSEELSRQIVIPWGERPNTRISIETALTHMVLEDMIHYGELSAALWQMGLDAPYIGFWRYKYQNLNGV
jgi:uncharacterized damage-inducible protein DinB